MARGAIVTRQLKSGRKRYDTVIRIDGRQRWKTFTKKKEAEDYLDRHSTDIRDGTYREIKKARFRDYAKHWQETHLIPQNFKPSTLSSYLSVFEKHIRPEFEHMGMQAISSAEINAFKAKLQKADLHPRTVRNVLNLVGKFFHCAVKDSYIRPPM